MSWLTLCALRLAVVAIFALLTGTWAFSAVAQDATPGKRVALVIGNGEYQAVPTLANPPHDARAVAASLQRLGFDTELLVDADLNEMMGAVARLGAKASDATVALVFYAGHAAEFQGRNVLVPVTARVVTAADLVHNTMRLDVLTAALANKAATTIIILDACRDDPFAPPADAPGDQRAVSLRQGKRSVSRSLGLAEVSSGDGMLIAFAAAPGHVANDGGGDHSPFTQALLAHIEDPDIEIRQMLGEVRRSVRLQTAGQQIPWDNSSLEDSFYFRRTKVTVCDIPPFSGMVSPGGATATMNVANSGHPCSVRFSASHTSFVPFLGLRLAEPPIHGVAEIQGSNLDYTPQAGFLGHDRFVVVTTLPRGHAEFEVNVQSPYH